MLAKRSGCLFLGLLLFPLRAKISYGEAPLEHDASGRAGRQDDGAPCIPAYNALWFVSRARIS